MPRDAVATQNRCFPCFRYIFEPIATLASRALNTDSKKSRVHTRRFELMLTILVVILLLVALGALPTWPYSRGWGYYPSGGLGLVLLILVILLLMGQI